MLELSDARPDSERDVALRTEVNRRLLDSLQYILEACQSANIDTSRHLEAVTTCLPNEKLSGMLHVLHNRLLDAVRRNATEEIKAVLSAFGEYAYSYGDARVIYWYDNTYSKSLYELYFDASDDGFRKTYGAHFDGTLLKPEEISPSIQDANLAIQRLKSATRDLYDEFNALVSDVMIFHSPTMNAASSISSLGIIRTSQIRKGQLWTRYFENLVHEAAHQHLNYLWFFDPIILNEGEQLYASPLRKEMRPLSGIYHALFVLARTIRAVEILKKSDEYDERVDFIETAYNNKGNNASFADKFTDCWELIQKHATLTDLGKKLMLSSREYAFDR